MEIRDARNKEWFWLDNEYLNGYAKHLGVTSSIVYISLCRHADNKTQTCFPSMEQIGEENGIKRNAVSRAIKLLKEWNIISVQEEYDKKNKRRKNNIYTLLAKVEWKQKPCTDKVHGSSEKPCTPNEESHAPLEGSNKTHINNTHNTAKQSFAGEIPLVIDLFNEVNPSYKKWYGNTTQRSAISRLLEIHGFEKIGKVIAILPKTNKMTYVPTITTPLQLEDKWATLESTLTKKKEELQDKTINKFW